MGGMDEKGLLPPPPLKKKQKKTSETKSFVGAFSTQKMPLPTKKRFSLHGLKDH